MKKRIPALLIFYAICIDLTAQFSLELLSPLPEPLSNGAIEYAEMNSIGQVFIWGSLDSAITSEGIHKRGYKLDLELNVWSELPELPDSTGKLSLSASRIGDIIYLIGGYHVLENGFEISSNKVHRFSVSQNSFLEDASVIPVPIDDQIQFTFRDSLIYVVSGWSNTSNVTDVQVYNPDSDTWLSASPVPSSGGFRVFGSSGCVIGDTIYYFGGAVSNGINFPASNRLCKGIINPENPLDISWESTIPDASIKRYRSACIVAGELPHWVGGSSISYNYDGIAYNGSGPVSPEETILKWNLSEFESLELDGLPMDIRSIARINDTTWVIAGGLLSGPEVSNKVWKLSYSGISGINEIQSNLLLYPVPAQTILKIKSEKKIVSWNVSDFGMKEVLAGVNTSEEYLEIDTGFLNPGVYWIKLHHPKGEITFRKFIKN